MFNHDQSYISQNDDVNISNESNNFPIKFSTICKATEVLSTTKSLTRNTDKYTKFISKYKVQNNPNLISNTSEIQCLPEISQNKEYEITQKSEHFRKKSNNEFINTQYFKLTTAANTLWFPNNSEKNIRINQSLSKYSNPNGFFSNKNSNTINHTSTSSNNLLPKIVNNYKHEKILSKISFTNILPDLNVVFDFIKKPRYETIRYDVTKIFFNDKYYFEMLREKIEEMKNSSKFEIEEKGFLVKKFYEKNKKISMTLNSIIIEFNFPTTAFKDPIIHFLPLCLLPLFYFNDPQDIKYLFMSLMEFSNDFEDINLNFQKMYNFVIFSDKYDTTKAESIEFSKEKFSVNVFNFKWFTPKYEFDVKIRLPEIKLVIEENKKYCKYANPCLMLYIIGNNYLNWDFYCLNFIISDVDFRKTLNLLSSKEYQKREEPNSFFLSEIDSSKPVFMKEENFSFSLKENKLSVFFTNEKNQNFINTLLPYKIHINHTKIKTENPFIFDFNFKQMVTLAKIYMKWNLSKFFKKILEINFKRRTITMDKEYLEKIDDGFLDFTIPYDEFVDIAHQHIDLRIQKPRMLVESINGTEYIKYEYDLDDKMLKLLVNTEAEKWVKVLTSQRYFMRDKVVKKTKLPVSFKKVVNVNGLLQNVRKGNERSQSGKHKDNIAKSLKQSGVKEKVNKKILKRRGSSELKKLDFEGIVKKLSISKES